MPSILSKLANYDEFDTAAGGGTKTYWRGFEKIVPAGKDDMVGNPDGLGGNRTRPLPGKLQKDSFKKKGKKTEYSMKKVAIKFSAGTVAGPKNTIKQMGKVTSGFPMSKIFKTTQTKPISGSAQQMVKTSGDNQMDSFLIKGFADELQKEAGIGRMIKGVGKLWKRVAKPIAGPGLTGAKTRRELAGEAIKGTVGATKQIIKKHPGKAGLAAGAGAGYMLTGNKE
ncbi:hypothetical protein LCGC14_0516550 [marine sediment metagenome]|uniref:Uncharacterized protein n=1 Tax=marine sediment metagenome TaxID=412755 RepID=A0A0F9SI61_9ZZZZ